ncbi:MAG TPA: aldo/keto reductase [Cytophagales bacterium]|nr:aldo/keto reductase [Cytophagales bacterium]
MKYNQLGKSDLHVSEIGFGCMSLAGDESESVKLLQEAFSEGINYFDTADLYDKGENEKIVGRALKGIREKVYLGTKVGNQRRKDGSGWDWNPSKKYILTAVEGSLKRLQTDYIDLYQLHGGTIDDPIDETIEAFEILKQQGKIRFYGISSIRPEVIREYIKRSAIVSVMMQYGLLDRRPEESCLDLLEKNKIGVFARGVLAKGLLVNKNPVPFLSYSFDEVQNAADAIKAVAGNTRSATETAIRYVFHQPAVSAAIIGVRTRQQLKEACAIAGSRPLSDTEIQKLKHSVKIIQYEQFR